MAREEFIRVEVVRPFCLGNGGDVYPGDIVELPGPRARRHLERGTVKLAGKKRVTVSPRSTVEDQIGRVVTSDESPSHREPESPAEV